MIKYNDLSGMLKAAVIFAWTFGLLSLLDCVLILMNKFGYSISFG